ncbi:Flagellar assembly factor FliW [uncultured Clostridium sp.]|uniref:flagellar assembly protein FliW n=1 Tax=uncultured Clostridium sp. TaxID=59620 RepID=UPI000822CC6F|nr:flagellar assembly protein FliW [uncultured Clostridium sp.]SCJ98131.1 Flagellar assembly factor FliW [uncultured Clostridium sp.]
MQIVFKRGIPGFKSFKNFQIDEIKNNEKFKVMSSLDEEVSFIVVSPFDFYSEYELNLDNETIKDLEIKDSKDVLILNIITLGETLEKSTINLKAPIVININNSLAKQYIMQCDTYDTKHPLIRREKNVSNY